MAQHASSHSPYPGRTMDNLNLPALRPHPALGVAHARGGMAWHRTSQKRRRGGGSRPSRGARAQGNLGVLYYKGEGVVRDRAEAVKWWRLAAEQGEEHGRRMLESVEQE